MAQDVADTATNNGRCSENPARPSSMINESGAHDVAPVVFGPNCTSRYMNLAWPWLKHPTLHVLPPCRENVPVERVAQGAAALDVEGQIVKHFFLFLGERKVHALLVCEVVVG